MTKTKERVITAEKVDFDVSKTDLKNIIKAHKRFSALKAEGSPLSLIHFKLEDEKLTIETTDGVRALITEMNVFVNNGDNIEFFLNTNLLSKINLLKDKITNSVKITKNGDYIEFYDFVYNTKQIFGTCNTNGIFPDIKSIICNKPSFEIGVNPNLIKDIASLTTKKGYLSIFLNPKMPTAPIIVNANSEDIEQKAIVMPIDINHKEEKEDA